MTILSDQNFFTALGSNNKQTCHIRRDESGLKKRPCCGKLRVGGLDYIVFIKANCPLLSAMESLIKGKNYSQHEKLLLRHSENSSCLGQQRQGSSQKFKLVFFSKLFFAELYTQKTMLKNTIVREC